LLGAQPTHGARAVRDVDAAVRAAPRAYAARSASCLAGCAAPASSGCRPAVAACGHRAGSHATRPSIPGLVVLDDPVDEPVLDGLVGLEEAVALHVAVNLLLGLPGVVGVDLVGALADVEDLAGVDLDVGGLTLEPRRRLVDEDPAVG